MCTDYYYLFPLLLYYFLHVFHTSVNWWSEQQLVFSVSLDSPQYSGRPNQCRVVSARPPIFNSRSPFTKPSGIVPSAPITIGITVTFTFHKFYLFSSQVPSTFLTLRFLWFSHWGVPGRQHPLFGTLITRSGFLTRTRRFTIIIVLLFWEFFTQTLADGFSLKFEWQYVPLCFMDSSPYSGKISIML